MVLAILFLVVVLAISHYMAFKRGYKLGRNMSEASVRQLIMAEYKNDKDKSVRKNTKQKEQ